MPASKNSELLTVINGRVLIDSSFSSDMLFAANLKRIGSLSPVSTEPSIVIEHATRTEVNGVVVVTGACSILGLVNVPVAARATIEPAGPDVTLRFMLIGNGQPSSGTRPTAGVWCFSQSFPNLAPLPFFRRATGGTARPEILDWLDTLLLTEAQFVFTTTAQTDAVTGAALTAGLNFVGQMIPTGMLGMIDPATEDQKPLVLSGPIIPALPSDVTPPLIDTTPRVFPWQAKWLVPGIHLTAKMNVQTALGGTLPLHDLALHVYYPTDSEWLDNNDTYAPIAGITATANFSSAGITAELTALDVGASSQTTLIGDFTGLSLKKLEDLMDITGGSDFITILPDDVRHGLASATGGLSLENVMLTVGSGYNVRYASIVVGMQGMKTVVLPDFSIENLRTQLSLSNPLSKTGRAYGVSLGGTIGILGAQFDVQLRLPTLVLTAVLNQSAQVNLTELFKYLKLLVPPDLPNLTLDTLEFSLDKAGKLSFFALVADTPGWSFSLGNAPLTLKNLSASFSRAARQGASYSFGGSVAFSGLSFISSISHQGTSQGWFLSCSCYDPAGIPASELLKDLVSKLDVTVPDILMTTLSGIHLKNLAISIDTAMKAFTLNADITEQGIFPLGAKSYQLEQKIYLSSQSDPITKKQVVSGHLEADLVIGGQTFLVMTDFGIVKKVTGLWRSTDGKSIGFGDIAHAIGIDDPLDTRGLDLSLKSLSFTHDSIQKSFTLSAESNQWGDAFLSAGPGTDGKWGLVLGVETPRIGKLSSLPSIGKDLAPADFISFGRLTFLISTNDVPGGFSVPVLPPLPPTTFSSPSVGISQMGTTGRKTNPMIGGQPLPLTRGFTIAGEVDFAGSPSNKRMRNLAKVLGGSSLLLQVGIGLGSLNFAGAINNSLRIPMGGKNAVAFQSPRVSITLVAVPPITVLQISGSTDLNVLGMAISASAGLVISETEAQFRCLLQDSASTSPKAMRVPVVGSLPVGGLGVVMGVFFEPPGGDFGIEGKLQFGIGTAVQHCDFAIVVEAVEEIPNLLYLAFDSDGFSLGDIVSTFSKDASPQAMQALNFIKTTSASFYFCESVLVLPDGTVTQPGFGFSAPINMIGPPLGYAEFGIGTTQGGLHGKGELIPINLRNVLVIEGDGRGIKRNSQTVNGQSQAVSNKQVSRTAAGQSDWVVKPGGAVIEFNAFSSPFIHVNFQVSLFDVVKAAVDGTVDVHGISFTVSFDVGNIEKFDMGCVLNGRLGFRSSANLFMRIKTSVGPIHVNEINVGTLRLDVRAVVAIAITLDSNTFALSLDGQFDFEGLHMKIPTINCSIAPKSLQELPDQLITQIKSSADAIFSALFSDASKWSDMIGRGVVTGVTDMGSILKSAYLVTNPADVVKFMDKANQSADTIYHTLKTTFAATDEKTISDAFKTLSHTVDKTVVPHGDTVITPHGDSKTPHGDGNAPPHGDTRSPHGDSGSHTDNRNLHIDAGNKSLHTHTDHHNHTDAGAHFDTPSAHVDTPAVHADVASIHTDVPTVHADTPSTHIDTTKSPH